MNDYEFDQKLKAVMRIQDNEHFDETIYEEAVSKLENVDGTKGPKYTIDEVKNLLKKSDLCFDSYNVYDVAFAINMCHADYSEIIPEKDYLKFADAFLNDPDGPQGKAVKYYMAMNYPNTL